MGESNVMPILPPVDFKIDEKCRYRWCWNDVDAGLSRCNGMGLRGNKSPFGLTELIAWQKGIRIPRKRLVLSTA